MDRGCAAVTNPVVWARAPGSAIGDGHGHTYTPPEPLASPRTHAGVLAAISAIPGRARGSYRKRFVNNFNDIRCSENTAQSRAIDRVQPCEIIGFYTLAQCTMYRARDNTAYMSRLRNIILNRDWISRSVERQEPRHASPRWLGLSARGSNQPGGTTAKQISL